MSEERNIVSVSGGKDSTALLLLAIERETPNLEAVFADTGHEHAQTYEYIQYLNDKVFPIRTIKADFSKQIEGRRQMMQRVIEGTHKDQGKYVWSKEIAEHALTILQPTGIPFLDMCMVHGRFPSTRVRFCSDELKKDPIIKQVQMPVLEAGDDLVSWQGVRADESPKRALLPERECKLILPNGAEMWNYRPILQWTVADVFAMHDKHGVAHNPLYRQGMGRVGCMPCIHARKDEVLEISKRFPEEFERVAKWENIVRQVSKTGVATFFAADGVELKDITLEEHGIWGVVKWSQTSRGKSNFDMFRMQNDGPLCTSIYGLCE